MLWEIWHNGDDATCLYDDATLVYSLLRKDREEQISRKGSEARGLGEDSEIWRQNYPASLTASTAK